MSGVTLLSRILGLLRETVRGHLLGSGAEADAFTIGFTIPNLLRRLLAEGATSAGFIPVFSRYLYRDGEEHREEAWDLACRWLTLITLALIAATLLGVVLAPLVVRYVVAPGFASVPGKVSLTVLLTRILFVYLLLVGLASWCQGVLNSMRVFVSPALSPVVLNLAMILSGLLVSVHLDHPSFGLAGGVLVGGLGQILIQVPSLRRLGFRWRWGNPLGHPGVWEILRLMIPAAYAAGIYQINAAVAKMVASFLGNGPATALDFSNRLTEFSLGIYVVALSTVWLPSLSRAAAEERDAEFRGLVKTCLGMVGLITIPATVGLYVIQYPLIRTCFQYGLFDRESTELTAFAFRYHVLGLSFVGACRVLVPAFYARKDLSTPVRIGFAMMIVHVLLCLVLGLGTPLRHGGIALACTLASGGQMVLLYAALRRVIGPIGGTELAVSILRVSLAAGGMGVVCLAVKGGLEGLVPGRIGDAIVVFGTVAAGLGAFGGLAWLLRIREWRLLLESLGLRRDKGSLPGDRRES